MSYQSAISKRYQEYKITYWCVGLGNINHLQQDCTYSQSSRIQIHIPTFILFYERRNHYLLKKKYTHPTPPPPAKCLTDVTTDTSLGLFHLMCCQCLFSRYCCSHYESSREIGRRKLKSEQGYCLIWFCCSSSRDAVKWIQGICHLANHKVSVYKFFYWCS